MISWRETQPGATCSSGRALLRGRAFGSVYAPAQEKIHPPGPDRGVAQAKINNVPRIPSALRHSSGGLARSNSVGGSEGGLYPEGEGDGEYGGDGYGYGEGGREGREGREAPEREREKGLTGTTTPSAGDLDERPIRPLKHRSFEEYLEEAMGNSSAGQSPPSGGVGGGGGSAQSPYPTGGGGFGQWPASSHGQEHAHSSGGGGGGERGGGYALPSSGGGREYSQPSSGDEGREYAPSSGGGGGEREGGGGERENLSDDEVEDSSAPLGNFATSAGLQGAMRGRRVPPGVASRLLLLLLLLLQAGGRAAPALPLGAGIAEARGGAVTGASSSEKPKRSVLRPAPVLRARRGSGRGLGGQLGSQLLLGNDSGALGINGINSNSPGVSGERGGQGERGGASGGKAESTREPWSSGPELGAGLGGKGASSRLNKIVELSTEELEPFPSAKAVETELKNSLLKVTQLREKQKKTLRLIKAVPMKQYAHQLSFTWTISAAMPCT
ncbi:hypothetical protein T492DRAFT_832189 [Pavlovales sp. CCMP2436]|nr:hypothetical protein T492DRAFT_832189 [Pavlovales sp. CCMP2436]